MHEFEPGKVAPGVFQGVPVCPSFLSKPSKRKWEELVPILQAMGCLTPAAGELLAAYCANWETFCQAQRQLQRKGIVQKGEKGVAHSVYLSIRNQAMEHMRKFSVMLGLDPATQQRLNVKAEGEQEADPLDKFFKAREGT